MVVRLPNTWAANTAANRVKSSNSSIFDSTSRTLFITGLQYEVGEKATPFEHEPFASQWAQMSTLLHRTYNIGGGDVHPENFILQHHSPPGKPGHVDVNNRGEWQMEWPVKRAAPTLTFTDLTNMRWLVGNNVHYKTELQPVPCLLAQALKVAQFFRP